MRLGRGRPSNHPVPGRHRRRSVPCGGRGCCGPGTRCCDHACVRRPAEPPRTPHIRGSLRARRAPACHGACAVLELTAASVGCVASATYGGILVCVVPCCLAIPVPTNLHESNLRCQMRPEARNNTESPQRYQYNSELAGCPNRRPCVACLPTGARSASPRLGAIFSNPLNN